MQVDDIRQATPPRGLAQHDLAQHASPGRHVHVQDVRVGPQHRRDSGREGSVAQGSLAATAVENGDLPVTACPGSSRLLQHPRDRGHAPADVRRWSDDQYPTGHDRLAS